MQDGQGSETRGDQRLRADARRPKPLRVRRKRVSELYGQDDNDQHHGIYVADVRTHDRKFPPRRLPARLALFGVLLRPGIADTDPCKDYSLQSSYMPRWFGSRWSLKPAKAAAPLPQVFQLALAFMISASTLRWRHFSAK